MKTKIFYGAGLVSLMCLSSCNFSAQRVEAIDVEPPVLISMKSEFVPAGEEAVLYGRNLTKAKVKFETQFYEETVEADVVDEKSNDSVLVCIVPRSAWSGKITVSTLGGETQSPFLFRDKRNIIMNFDTHHQTWGGFSPYETDGTMSSQLNPEYPLSSPLPEGCDGKYSVLYGAYAQPWAMDNQLLLQYMANHDEGGRGYVSVAGLPFVDRPVEDLVLKFECNIPKTSPYKGIRTEIFCGPKDSPDKHGRERSVICFWEPWTGEGYTVAGNNEGKDLSKGFYTDGWETVTIPLKEFKHNTITDEALHDLKMDLVSSVNFSFLQFGQPIGEPMIYMCVDNFRIVPAVE